MDFLVVLLIMVFAVVLADILAEFIPAIASPLIKIGIGIAISFLPLAAHFHISHEYFHLIFIAPLVYYGGMEISRKDLWKMKGTIANMAIVLLLITGFITGLVLRSLIPQITVVAAITLMSALGSTDHIAVDNVEKHSNVPHRLMELLKNESIFAEVTSVIFLQTCINVMGGEGAHLDHAVLEFLMELGGGLLVGAILGIGKFLLVRFLYTQGIKKTPLHTLIGVVFPFFAYIIADHFHVSGVVAIFLAGIISTFEYDEKVGEAIRLDNGAKNVWSFMSFTLDGLIFVYLGMQIPHTLEALIFNHMEIDHWWALWIILIVSGVILLIRFLWSLLTLPKYVYAEQHPISKVRAALLFAMSGARGAITWAAIGGIPAVLANGTEFPLLDEISVIAMGVIIVSLAISYIFLPIVAPVENKSLSPRQIDEARVNIFLQVADALEAEATAQTRAETNIVTFRYRDLADDIQMTLLGNKDTTKELDKVHDKVIEWKKENVKKLKYDNVIDVEGVDHFNRLIENQNPNHRRRSVTSIAISNFFTKLKARRIAKADGSDSVVTKDTFITVTKSNTEYVLSKLREEYEADPASEALELYIQKYEFNLSRLTYYIELDDPSNIDEPDLIRVERRALEIENTIIQDEFENGILPYEDAKKLKTNVAYAMLDLNAPSHH